MLAISVECAPVTASGVVDGLLWLDLLALVSGLGVSAWVLMNMTRQAALKQGNQRL